MMLRHCCSGLLLAAALLAATGCCCWRPFCHRRCCLGEPCCAPCEPCCAPACNACCSSPIDAVPPGEAIVSVPIPAPRLMPKER